MPMEISSISQQAAQRSTQNQYTTLKKGESLSSSLSEQPANDKQTNPVDRVSIAGKAQPVGSDAGTDTKNEAKKKEAQPTKTNDEQKTGRAVGEIQFDYNYKGDLRVRFMDKSNSLIYQIPPELVARVTDTIAKAQSSVDMKA